MFIGIPRMQNVLSSLAQSDTKITGTIVLNNATGNEAAFTLNYTTNKATSGNDTGLLINMTDTASPGTSLILDVQKAGTSIFCIDGANSKIGIGTTSPTGKLSIVDAASGSIPKVAISDGTTSAGLYIAVSEPKIQFGSISNTSLSFLTSDAHRVTITGVGNVGIGITSPNANAILDITSTTKAFMPPRMTQAQRDAIAVPTAGMMVYNSDTNVLNFYNGAAWGAV